MRLLAIQLALLLFSLFLLPDVLPDLGLIQPHRTHTVANGPKVQARHPAFLQQFAMNPHGTFPFQTPQRVGDAVLGRDTQTQMDMIGHAVSFHQLYAALAAQVSQDPTNLPPQFPVEDTLAVLWDDDDVILAFPPDMGQTLPVVHRVLLPVPAGLPGRRTYVSVVLLARRIAPKLFGSHGQRPWF